MDRKSGKTVCDQEAMVGFYLMLADIVQNLQTAYEKAESLAGTFNDCYLGDARDEVMTFLENLPLHIYRLELLYSKLAEFIATTAQSLHDNDMKMTEKMEG